MERFLFDTIWFAGHQKKLLWLLNKPLIRIWFRWVLRIRRYDCPLNKKIIGLLPNSFVIEPVWKRKKCINTPKGLVLFNKEIRLHRRLVKKYRYKMPLLPFFTQDFRTHNKYSKRLFYAFYPLWYLFHCWDILFANNFRPTWNLGYDTLTVYPDPGTGAITVDGVVGMVNQVDIGWSTVRNAAGNYGSANVSDAIGNIFATQAYTSTNNWRYIIRAISTFYTAALTADATIIAVVLSWFGREKNDTPGWTPNVDIYTATPAANNAIADTDYAQTGGTTPTSQTGSPITYANFSVTGYNDFTFNATGRGNVSKTGISRFSVRNANYDVANTQPTWSSNAECNINAYFADQTGTANDPKLVVTYTVPQTYYKTLPATEVAVLTLSRKLTWKKLLLVVETSIASLPKVVTRYKSLIVTEVSSVVLSFVKSFYRTLSIAESSIVSLVKKTFKTLTTTEISIPSLTTANLIPKALGIAEVSIAALSKIPGKILTVIATTIPIISLLKTLFRTLAATEISAITMSLVRKITLSATAISIATISRLKTFYRTLAATVIAMVRLKVPTHYLNKFTKQGIAYLNKFTKQGDDYHDKYF